jgi:hypothetical protein
VVEVYSDAGISGAKRRDQRPGLDAILNDASRRKFDVVMAWDIDRLGRPQQIPSTPARALFTSWGGKGPKAKFDSQWRPSLAIRIIFLLQFIEANCFCAECLAIMSSVQSRAPTRK